MIESRAGFLRELLVGVKTALRAEGFGYRGRSWYEMRLGPDTLGVVTLASNSYLNDPAIYLSPSVGVTHEPLERLLSNLCGLPLTKFLPATISSSLGYLTPARKYITYAFLPDDSLESGTQALVEAIGRYGVPWMRDHQQPDVMLEDLLTLKYSTRDHARFRVPLIFYLKKDYASAHDWIDKGLAEIGEKRNAYNDHYRQFAKGLLRKLSSTEVAD